MPMMCYTLQRIHMKIRQEVFGSLDRYLGANVNKVQLEYGRTVWYIAYIGYMRGDIKNIYLIL